MSIQVFRTIAIVIVASVVHLGVGVSSLSAAASGFLQTPSSSGVIGADSWAPPASGQGYRVTWDIYQNPDNTWHYKYTFARQDGTTLVPLTSHVIFQLSETAGEDDLFNFTGDIEKYEFGTFGAGSGNPGFPVGEIIFGIKINLDFKQEVVEFDSTRMPMWGDFYSKGGSANYAYNADLGTDVANPHDIYDTPVDANGNELFKILVPNTYIPEPATIGLLMLCAIGATRRTRRRSSY